MDAFYLSHFLDGEDVGEQTNKIGDVFSGDDRQLARGVNGEKLVLYSGRSAHSLEWLQPDLLASSLRLEQQQQTFSNNFSSSSPQQKTTYSSSIPSPILVVTACAAQNPQPVALSGSSFTAHPKQMGIAPAAYENELLINFRTFENGLFFYSLADHGDYLVVQLSAGRAEVFFDFGAQQRVELSGGVALNDGRWHELRWVHKFDGAELFVDAVRVNATEINGLYRKLDLHSEVEIGGRPEEFGDERIPFPDLELQQRFHGCLARMELNAVNLLAAAPAEWNGCQMPRPQLVSIGHSTSLQIPYTFLPFALEFHVLPVLVGSSTSLLSILDSANSSLLQVNLLGEVFEEEKEEDEDEGKRRREESFGNAKNLERQQLLSVSTGLNGERPKTFPLGTPGWHSLVLKLRVESLDLLLDGQTVFWVQGNQARQIGTGMQAFLLSAAGCYRSTTIDLNQGMPSGAEFQRDECPLIQRCSPNPCRNNGRCVQSDFRSFRCECPLNYTGRFCQISKLPYSCEQQFFSSSNTQRKSAATSNLPKKKSSTGLQRLQMIDLDGGGPLRPFEVECRRVTARLTKEKKKFKLETASILSATELEEQQKQQQQQKEEDVFLTVLHNDVPMSGIQVTGITEPGAVRRILDYGLGAEELEHFMHSFEQCEQRMRFHCENGQHLMTFSGENSRPSSWYATRNGQHGLQWGDAPPFSRMCSCALNDSCVAQNRQCSCDSGEPAAAVDEGVNHHIQLLPVLQLFIGGGTSHNSLANVTIGPLECSGRYVADTITFTDRNQRLFTTLSNNNNYFASATFQASISLRLAQPRLTVFTLASTNHERWFQLFVRDGRLVGQIAYAGVTLEVVSDVRVDDNRWHSIEWEVDEQGQKLRVDRSEVHSQSACIPPRASVLIVGSRTGKADKSGFAGQLRQFHVNGEPIRLGLLAQKALGNGIQLGEWSACGNGIGKCENEGRCVELYDGFRCNCSRTPFAGDTCEDEVGMWVPLGSELRIAWQHPGQVSNCFRMNVQTASTGGVNLIRARALFAESHFNLSIGTNGNLNAFIFDGFFFTQNVSFDKIYIPDNKSKDIRFCANTGSFHLSVNGETAFLLSGNFTFFSLLNVWHFADRRFTGCISRLMVGDAFPLKNPRESRLIHSGKIRFGSCPFDKIERRIVEESGGGEQGGEMSAQDEEIHASSFIKSQQRLLFITPAIGLLSALCILLSLCVFLVYVQRRPDGVYKTHEKSVGGGGSNLAVTSFSPPPPLLSSPPAEINSRREKEERDVERRNFNSPGLKSPPTLRAAKQKFFDKNNNGNGNNINALAHEKFAERVALAEKEFFC